MAISVTQVSTEISVSAGTSGNVTVTGVAAGALLIVVICQDSGATNPTFTVTDDKSGTWTNHVSLNNSTKKSQISSAPNAAGGNTVVTVTAGSSSTYRAFVIEVAGAATSSPLDASSSINEGSVTSHVCSATSTVIDTTMETLVVAVVQGSGTFGTITPGGSYTAITWGANDKHAQYLRFAAATNDERATWTSGTARSTVACIAAFQAAAAAAGQPTIRRFGVSKYCNVNEIGHEGVQAA